MRRFIRTPAISQQFARNSIPEYRPEKNDEKLRNWTSRISNLSTLPASRSYLSQLQALLTYYNKQIADTTRVTYYLISVNRMGQLELQNYYQGVGQQSQRKLHRTQLTRVRPRQNLHWNLQQGLQGPWWYCKNLLINRTTKWPSIQWSGWIITLTMLNSWLTSARSPTWTITVPPKCSTSILALPNKETPSTKPITISLAQRTTSTSSTTSDPNSPGAKKYSPSTDIPPMTTKAPEPLKTPWVVDL